MGFPCIPAGSFYAYEAFRRLGVSDTGGLRLGLALQALTDAAGALAPPEAVRIGIVFDQLQSIARDHFRIDIPSQVDPA